MLATCTAKDGELMIGSTVPLGLGQGSNRPAHGLIGNLEEAKGKVLNRLRHCSRSGEIFIDLDKQLLKCCSRPFIVQWLVLLGAENHGEVLSLDPA